MTLRIGRRGDTGNDVVFASPLPVGYRDITSVQMWVGAHEKWPERVPLSVLKQQVRLYVRNRRSLNEHDTRALQHFNERFRRTDVI